MLRNALDVTLRAAIACADAATLCLSHPHGELTDRNPVTARIFAGGARLGGTPRVQVRRGRREVTPAALRLPPGAPIEYCVERPCVAPGERAAGP